jgi:geranylgeranylglycerol-phosphate geranylgeranyltransferase
MNVALKAKAVADLMRIELPLAAGICVVAGEVLALGGMPAAWEAVLGFLVGFFVSASAMVSNDYFDIEVDRMNRPDRPLPSGRITTFELKLLTIIVSVAGLASAVLLGAPMFAIAVVFWAVGFLYNWRFKETGLPGNMMVSSSVAATFVCGGVAVGELTSGIVWTFGALAFMFNLGEEIAGDSMDVKGDVQRNARTLASARGRGYALDVSAVLFALFIAGSFIPYLAGWLGHVYLAMITFTNVVLAYFALKLVRSKTPEEGLARIRHLYLTVAFFVIALIIGGIL